MRGPVNYCFVSRISCLYYAHDSDMGELTLPVDHTSVKTHAHQIIWERTKVEEKEQKLDTCRNVTHECVKES